MRREPASNAASSRVWSENSLSLIVFWTDRRALGPHGVVRLAIAMTSVPAVHALEVKTTTKAGNTEITVSSMEQMAEPTGGTLHLFHLTLEPASNGLLTVSALARAATGKADQTDGIRDRLNALGCADIDAPEWNATALRYEDESLFEVGPGFPRLTPAMFPHGTPPAGVSGVTYRLDLLAAGTSGETRKP